MVDSTFDEHRRCPICNELGEPAGQETLPDRSTLYKFVCANPNCRWFADGTNRMPWLRQRRSDGTWVEAQKHEKFFPKIPDRTDEVRAALDRQLQAETGKGA